MSGRHLTMHLQDARINNQQKEFFKIPFWFQPDDHMFNLRADRFEQLASEEASDWHKYLTFLANLCRAQQILFDRHNNQQALTLPQTDHEERPLSTLLITSHSPLINHLFNELYTLLEQQLSPTAIQVWRELRQLEQQELIQLCVKAFNQQINLAQQDYTVWINAVLQIIYTLAAKKLAKEQIKPIANIGYCPCCGTDAVGSVIIGRGNLEGLRYLQCGICNSRWHSIRAHCSFCDSSHNLTIQNIEHTSEAALTGAEAECCPNCQSYRKRYRLAKQQYADPIADDLASLALDIMLSEEQWRRGGANPFLIMT